MRNEQKIKELRAKVKYYHVRSDQNVHGFCPGDVLTVCLVKVGDVIVRGMAYCFPKDQFCRKTGRTYALARAIRSLEKQCNYEPLPGRLKNDFFIQHVTALPFFKGMAEYNPVLSENERKILFGKENA